MNHRPSWIFAVLMCLTIVLTGCSAPQSASSDSLVAQTSSGDTNSTVSMSEETDAQLKEEVSAFEITKAQRELAENNEKGYEPLDAGRGNPNWINTKARYAFTRLTNFALAECERDMNEGDMAGHGIGKGIAERFDAAMDPNDETDKFLIDAVAYCVDELGMNKEDLLLELTDGIIGDYYPSPSRCLSNTETILNAYLQSTLYNGVDLKDQTQVFPTEGGSAAISYLFHSLEHNHVLSPGDKIAIATPIFTPYLEIPHVNHYDLVSIETPSTSQENWDIPTEELAKLENPEIKAFFLVNPSNPASHALSDATLKRLKQVVEKNPDLVIITDDVYGTFVQDFQTVYSVMPYNTVLVYSYSKLYGATGWRIGMIAMNKNNVVDRLISKLSDEDAADLEKEYSIVSTDVPSLPFIERLCADSRSIGLYHTSGLSTPSQVFMDLLSLTHLINKDQDPYVEQSKTVVHERYVTLMEALGLPVDRTRENAQYYALVDINELIAARYGKDFAEWKKASIDDVKLLDDLARIEGVVLMYGPGFDAPEGSVRISLANLNKEDYVEIASRLDELLETYYAQFAKETSPAAAA